MSRAWPRLRDLWYVSLPMMKDRQAKMRDKRWTLITGASGGIGREFALLLSRRGHNIILASRNIRKLEILKAEIGGNAAVEIMAADLSSAEGAPLLHQACAERGFIVDTLVNNAGSGGFGKAIDIRCADTARMLTLNVTSLTLLCALFGKDMAQRGEGRILNVGSLSGNQPTPYFASYAASKSYVLMYSLALRCELSGSGVTVTCLQPGYVATSFDDNAGIVSKSYRGFSRNHAMSAARTALIGIDGMERGRAVVIAGGVNRAAAFFSSLAPRRLLASVLKSTLKRIAPDMDL